MRGVGVRIRAGGDERVWHEELTHSGIILSCAKMNLAEIVVVPLAGVAAVDLAGERARGIRAVGVAALAVGVVGQAGEGGGFGGQGRRPLSRVVSPPGFR